MKKICYIICIFLIVFLCSGCVKFDGKMTIKNTKSMNISILYAIDKNVVDNEAISSENRKFLIDNGFIVKDYKKGSYEGITLKYKIKNIDKVSSNKDTKFSITSVKDKKIDDVFKVKKGWFKNKYKANFIFDATDVNNNISYDEENVEYLCSDGSIITIDENMEIPPDCFYATKAEILNAKNGKKLSNEELEKELSKNIDLKFSINLANGAVKNNATNVSRNKKELTWKLNDNGITSINFSFELYNYFHIFITIIGILFLIFVLIFVFFKLKEKFRRVKVRIRRRRRN